MFLSKPTIWKKNIANYVFRGQKIRLFWVWEKLFRLAILILFITFKLKTSFTLFNIQVNKKQYFKYDPWVKSLYGMYGFTFQRPPIPTHPLSSTSLSPHSKDQVVDEILSGPDKNPIIYTKWRELLSHGLYYGWCVPRLLVLIRCYRDNPPPPCRCQPQVYLTNSTFLLIDKFGSILRNVVHHLI